MSQYLNFDPTTNVLTITPRERVEYIIGSKAVTGEVTLKKDTVVKIRAKRGYKLTKDTPSEILFQVSPLEEVESGEPENPEVDPEPSNESQSNDWDLS